jgi:putative membrane protein
MVELSVSTYIRRKSGRTVCSERNLRAHIPQSLSGANDPMQKRMFSFILVSLLLSSSLFAATDCPPAGSLSFTTTLSGNQFGGQGSSSGFGNGMLTIDPATGQGTLDLSTGGLGNLTSAGLFRTTSGGSSQQVLSLTDNNNTFSNGSLQRSITISPALLSEIMQNPGNFSFGVSSGEFPNGALSGTLASTQTFGGSFSGASVVGGTGAQNGGGSFTADIAPSPSGTGSVLNYSFVPSGIGNSITGLELRQGLTGSNGSLASTLSGNATLTNGRLTGSVPISNDLAQQLRTNPSGFYLTANTSQFATGAARAQFGMVQNEYYLPVAGSLQGVGGRWETEIQVFNTSSGGPATVTMQRLSAGQDNTNASGTINATNAAVISVMPRGLTVLDTAMQTLFGLQTSQGAMRIISDQPIVVYARIYQSGRGTVGQTVKAMTRCEALARGILAGVSNTSAQRTNVGFFNPSSSAVQVHLQLTNGQGQSLGDTTMTLAPYTQMQMSAVGGGGMFTNLGAASVDEGVISYHASGPIFAYISTIDNATGDANLTVAAEDESGTAMALTEAEIAAVVTAANEGEVQQGTLAQNRAVTGGVRTFAQQMVQEHSAALQMGQAVFTQLGITPQENAMSQFLRTQAQTTLSQLQAIPASSLFDRSYMQVQVQMHTMVLTNLDQVLIPSARSAQMRQLLLTQRAEVAEHLQEAQDLLAALQ